MHTRSKKCKHSAMEIKEPNVEELQTAVDWLNAFRDDLPTARRDAISALLLETLLDGTRRTIPELTETCGWSYWTVAQALSELRRGIDVGKFGNVVRIGTGYRNTRGAPTEYGIKIRTADGVTLMLDDEYRVEIQKEVKDAVQKTLEAKEETDEDVLKNLWARLIKPDDEAKFRHEIGRIPCSAPVLMKDLLDAACRGELLDISKRLKRAVEIVRTALAGTGFTLDRRGDGVFLALREVTPAKRMISFVWNIFEVAKRGQFNGAKIPLMFEILQKPESQAKLQEFVRIVPWKMMKRALETLEIAHPELGTFIAVAERQT